MPATLCDYLMPISAALKERDISTAAHGNRTSGLALELGRQCALSMDELSALCIAARVHDVGKIGIPDHVLHKAGTLDDEEWALMKTHSERGHAILSAIRITGMERIAHAVRHHHEGYDGSGYPGGLCGEDIPVLARMITLADSYDAMTELRPYHTPKSHRDIMQVMHNENGGKYDPYLLARFSTLIETSAFRVN